MICAGIDAGSRTLKIVLVDADRLGPVASGVVDQGIDQDRLALDLLEKLLHEQGLRRDDLRAVVATGYGRKLVRTADTTITEITCQARGVRHCVPDARTIVDIGGQDSKLVRLKENGAVADFVMNDRCAAGTGRFLEMLAAQLGTPFHAVGIARRAEPRAGRHQQHVRGICRKRDCRALGGGGAAGGYRHGRANGDRHADCRHDRAETGGADPLYRGSRLGAGHGRRAGGRVGKARADRPPAAIDLRPGRGPAGRRPARGRPLSNDLRATSTFAEV